ncbi:MAG: hypothetical protein QM689_06935 [Oscillospiraceae bacterium]
MVIFMEVNQVQEMMMELRKIPQDQMNHTRQKIAEIMITLFKQEQIWVLLGQETTPETYGTNNAYPRLALSHLKRLSVWMFSSEQTARQYIDKHQYFVTTGNDGVPDTTKPLCAVVTGSVAAGIAYQGMFKGALDVVLDDGSLSLIISTSDFVNFAFMAQGKERIITPGEGIFIDTINIMRFQNSNIYVCADKETAAHQLMAFNFRLDATGNAIKLFAEEAISQDYARKVLGHAQFSAKATLKTLAQGLVNMLPDRLDYRIELYRERNVFVLSFLKALQLLDKMGIVQRQGGPLTSPQTQDTVADDIVGTLADAKASDELSDEDAIAQRSKIISSN